MANNFKSQNGIQQFMYLTATPKEAFLPMQGYFIWEESGVGRSVIGNKSSV